MLLQVEMINLGDILVDIASSNCILHKDLLIILIKCRDQEGKISQVILNIHLIPVMKIDIPL